MTDYRNACAYIRVSTDKQEELSPDAQKRLIIEYAKKNNFILINEHIFFENGVSGRKADKRPAFQDMIAMAKDKEHPFDVILVWKYSRFARNQEESIVYKSLLKKNNVEVISISEPLIDGPFGSLIERIIEWMDEYYSIRLSSEVKRGMSEKALKGGYQSAPALGYKQNKLTGVPDIYEPEARIVRKIYSLYDQGFSNVEICRQLNDVGFRTRKGNTFESRTVTYILSNPFYCGKIRWNRQDHSTHTIKSQDEWIVSQGSHAALFDEEYFEHIQRLMSQRRKPQKARSVGLMKNWLSGMVKCSSCGKSLVTNINKSSWQCNGYNKGSCSDSHHIKNDVLEASILQAFKDVIDDSAPLEFIVRASTVCEIDDTAAIVEQLEKMNIKLERVKHAYRDGIDTLEEYKENKCMILDEIDKLKTKLNELNKSSAHNTDNSVLMRAAISNVFEVISDAGCDPRVRALALRSVVDHIVWDKVGDELKVYFYLGR